MLADLTVFISRATIYNNLNELSNKGFLKKVLVKRAKWGLILIFINIIIIYNEEDDSLVDVTEKEIKFSIMPMVKA